MKKILVTGGAGFIGANLVPKLVAAGHTVTVYDNLSRGRRDYLEGVDVRLVEGDIRDREKLRAACQGMDAVIHLAAYGSVVESVEDPFTNFEINCLGTLNVLDAVRHGGVRKMVFASTGGALIGDAIPPVNEQSLPKPISPYGASKLVGEAYLHAFAKTYGITTVATRFANVYGPLSGHKKGALTVFMKSIMRGEPLRIFGDGTASRDFIHVDDLCQGIMLAAEAAVPGGSVYHIASGVETRIRDLAALVVDVAGVPGHPVVFADKRPGEVDRNFATYDLARKELGYEPKIPLRSGIEMTWRWYRDQGEKVLSIVTTDS